MKIISTPLAIVFCTICQLTLQAQTLRLKAPDDLVLSSDYVFDLDRLADPTFKDFGTIALDSNSIGAIQLIDRVCYSFCQRNPWISYPGALNVPGKTYVADKACELYYKYFDTAHSERRFLLNWGQDGYAFGIGVHIKDIQIADFRKCGQGLIQRIFLVEDAQLNTAIDTQDIWIIDCDFKYPITLKCQFEVKPTLDLNTCDYTVTADQFLDLGGQDYCDAFYKVSVHPKILGGSQIKIDRDSLKAGSQLGVQDIDILYNIRVSDIVTGSSCSSQVKLQYAGKPRIVCPADLSISCLQPETPDITGIASEEQNCISSIPTYKDIAEMGACDKAYSKIIKRTWRRTDSYRNFSECLQYITVKVAEILDLKLPESFNDTTQGSLKCSDQLDSNFLVADHLLDAPICLDGFILDSLYYLNQLNEPDIFPNRRRPRVLGWNAIADPKSPSGYTVSPDPVYYKSYSTLSGGKQGGWEADEYIQWKGTGRPVMGTCYNFAVAYNDIYLSSGNPSCLQKKTSCMKIQRRWTIIDWCTAQFLEYRQWIKISDTLAPSIDYPSEIELTVGANQLVDWIVQTPRKANNCSDFLDYTIESPVGTIEGNADTGYKIIGIPVGRHSVLIKVKDCCGNNGEKIVSVIVKLPSSVSESEDLEFVSFPNPVKDKLYIQYQFAYDRIKINSMDGRFEKEWNGSQNNGYDVQQLPPGVYTLSLFAKGNLLTQRKIVKE